MKRIVGLVVWCALASALFTGCRGVRFSESTRPKIGERSEDDRQRQADQKAMQLGQKPAPVNYTRE
ncbi:MAG: hypothetical protein KF715_03550 [Candidatus Didemnitutus sp.]|nr:hypothetical protein [Candidatus Didemnitutus sp.]